MTILRHELRQARTSFFVWTCSIAFLIIICVFMFPEMKTQMDSVSGMFASMGSFSAAFGLDRLNFGSLIGFYSVECGNILGLGGAFFAAFIAVAILSKEEKDRTAEFLLTHPVSRGRIITEKLASVMIQIVSMNLIIFLLSVSSIAAVGETIPWKEIVLIHLAYLFMQIELAGICFGISAFSRRGSLGIGLGIAILMYFFNIIRNLSEQAKFFRFITPFAYTEGADIVEKGHLDTTVVLLGLAYAVIGIVLAHVEYSRKDIR